MTVIVIGFVAWLGLACCFAVALGLSIREADREQAERDQWQR